ncbi:MAG: hypothetical protein IJA69_04790 [Clostridia bacterium]|nr:hypothetical protein [Clostridia bacterium]
MIEKTQSAPTLKILDGDGNEGGVYNIVPAVRLVDVNENYSTKYKLYKYEIEISDTTTEKSFMIEATTSRVVNKETQYTKSTMEVFLYDFRLDAEKTYVNAQQTNVFVANTTKEEVLDITIGAEYYGDNKRDFESFLSSKVFQKDNFAVNIDYLSYLPQTQINDLRYNLHYVNGNSSTPIYKINKNGTGEFVASDIVEFDAVEFEGGSKLIVKGLKNATQNMRLSIDYYVQVDGGTKRFTFTYDFSIKVEKYTDEDVPDEISNESAFLAINDEEIAEPKDYILTKDLVLYDYVAFENTQKINSIDGNGHTITIVNFKTDFEEENISTLNLALFNEVSKNTTLKNVRVNIYHVGSVSVDTSKIKTFNYAPLAITNEGIITNCEVVAYGALTNVITPKNIGIYANLPTTSDLSSHMAGFVITNNGSITNSRVGGEQIVTNYKIDRGVVKSSTTEVLPMLTIYGKGEMSGFVYENKGLISSSFASNIRIVNLTDVDYTTTTSGFVSKNSGTITMSYVKGVKKNGTEVHASKYGIETAGISAGFVCENEGTISDSYSNIMLTNVSNNP